MNQSPDLPVIGVVGGIGSGKSSVPKRLATRRRLVIIDADRVGHELLENEEVKQELRIHFGDSVFTEDGVVHRRELAKHVFGPTNDHTEARDTLNSILHPRIRTNIEQRIREVNLAGEAEAIVLDAALMLETGWNTTCDCVVFIDVAETTRIQRVVENRGWTESELKKREANQFSIEKKKQLSHHIIDNNSTLDAAAEAMERVLDELIHSGNRSND